MRTHLIKELSIYGKEKLVQIPDFDLHRLSLVNQIILRCEEKDSQTKEYHLEFKAVYRVHDGGMYHVAFRLANIRFAKLPPLTPSFYFTELEVEDISEDQIEGVRYRIKSYGMTEFEVLAQNIEVLRCKLIKQVKE